MFGCQHIAINRAWSNSSRVGSLIVRQSRDRSDNAFAVYLGGGWPDFFLNDSMSSRSANKECSHVFGAGQATFGDAAGRASKLAGQ